VCVCVCEKRMKRNEKCSVRNRVRSLLSSYYVVVCLKLKFFDTCTTTTIDEKEHENVKKNERNPHVKRKHHSHEFWWLRRDERDRPSQHETHGSAS